MFSTFHDELQYISLEKNFIFMVFLAVKDAGTDVIWVIFVAQNKRNLICVALNDVRAKKTMKMKFFSKKIYYISSWNVLNIANMQNPKWLYMHFIKSGLQNCLLQYLFIYVVCLFSSHILNKYIFGLF